MLFRYLLVFGLEIVFLFGESLAQNRRGGLFRTIDFWARMHPFQGWQRHKLLIEIPWLSKDNEGQYITYKCA